MVLFDKMYFRSRKQYIDGLARRAEDKLRLHYRHSSLNGLCNAYTLFVGASDTNMLSDSRLPVSFPC